MQYCIIILLINASVKSWQVDALLVLYNCYACIIYIYDSTNFTERLSFLIPSFFFLFKARNADILLFLKISTQFCKGEEGERLQVYFGRDYKLCGLFRPSWFASTRILFHFFGIVKRQLVAELIGSLFWMEQDFGFPILFKNLLLIIVATRDILSGYHFFKLFNV